LLLFSAENGHVARFHFFSASSVENSPLQSTRVAIELRPVDCLEPQRENKKEMNAWKEFTLLLRQSG